jgi:hypothetical protein
VQAVSDDLLPPLRKRTLHMSVRRPFTGDTWTFTAIDADSKLCISWLVGARTAANAYEIMCDIRDRVSNKIQLTTDQLAIYMKTVDQAFIGTDVDYGMLHKIYAGGGDGRYSPAESSGASANRSLATRTRSTSVRPTSSART